MFTTFVGGPTMPLPVQYGFSDGTAHQVSNVMWFRYLKLWQAAIDFSLPVGERVQIVKKLQLWEKWTPILAAATERRDRLRETDPDVLASLVAATLAELLIEADAPYQKVFEAIDRLWELAHLNGQVQFLSDWGTMTATWLVQKYSTNLELIPTHPAQNGIRARIANFKPALRNAQTKIPATHAGIVSALLQWPRVSQ